MPTAAAPAPAPAPAPATRPAAARRAPGPRGSALLGSLTDLRDDPLAFLLDAASFGPVSHFRLGRIHGYLVSQPSGVKHVLQDNSENYGRQTRGFKSLRLTLGDGLLTSDGEPWRVRRRVAQPAFHKQRLAGFASIMSTAAQDLVERWRGRAARAEPTDVLVDLLGATLQILGRSLFTQDLTDAASAVERALMVVLKHTMTITQAVLPLPPPLPTPANRRFAAALRTLDQLVYASIAERRRGGGDRGDLLSMLLAARDEETGEGMNDRQLRDEVMTLMLAGHETTATALAWTLTLLSRHPAARRTLEAEVDMVLGGRPPTLDDLPRLPRTRMVLEEAMRLYPPAWVVTRSVTADDEIDGFHIPGGSMVFVSPYVTHRDPTLWENPEGFDPDRFAPPPPDAPARPRYAYFPFGGGPHLCIGAAFAMMEAQIVLASVVQRLRLDLIPGVRVEPKPLITLRPRDGILMTVRSR